MLISSLDLEVRLQLSGQKYSEMLNKYLDILRYGKRGAEVYESKLNLLGIYIELLQDYEVDECGHDQTNNCLTEDQANLLFDKISQLTKVCFQPLGFNYTGTTSSQVGISKMQIGCNFIIL